MADSIGVEGFYVEVGRRIARRRQQRKISQEALARRVGLTRSSLSNIESGRQHTSSYILYSLADQLSVEIAALFPDAPQKPSLEAIVGKFARGKREEAFIKAAIGSSTEGRIGGTRADPTSKN